MASPGIESQPKMAVERIESAGDSRVAAYRDLRDAELVRQHGLFVAEGRLVVRRVIEEPGYRAESILVNEASLRDLEPVLGRLAVDVPVFVCAAADLARIAGYDVHRGCLALVRRPPPTPIDELFERAAMLVVMEAVANADNVGGVFRNAAAFGAGGVLLSPACCDPLYRKSIRTSMGAALRVPFARADDADWPGVLTRVRRAGFTIAALTPHAPSETLDAFVARSRPEKLALLVGAEGTGLTPAVERAADYRVRIPIADGVDSLNLAVATGIALYHFRSVRPLGGP
jgi:tRNA G18 (ribose-2'-O)-methylase SpoU